MIISMISQRKARQRADRNDPGFLGTACPVTWPWGASR